ncbi:MAG: peptidoglycan DD-metalloendopeptidase family protein, partial [Bacteroidota bacterium]
DVFSNYLKAQEASPAAIVPADLQNDQVVIFDFSSQNPALDQFDLTDVGAMNRYVFGSIEKAGAKLGAGGYLEERAVYQKSAVFDTMEGASRSIHLGIDLWMPAGTPIFCPLAARVHSFQDNANFGDYGPTIILEHPGEITFYSLYGHLSRESLLDLAEGQVLKAGEKFAAFGSEAVNGNWTPHLHFQLILDMQGKKGDYIGVAPKSELDFYKKNCPDPNLILGIPGLESV